MHQKSRMKGKDDADSEEVGEASVSSAPSAGRTRTSTAPDASSLASFVQQERICKDLYLSMGVHPNDIADTSDDDVASILEQMSRLHSGGRESGATADRNIEDILREAESLLDGPNASVHPRLKSSSNSSRSGSGASAKVNSENDSSSLQRILNVTQTIQSEADSEIKQADADSPCDEPFQQAFKTSKHQAVLIPSHIAGTPLEVTYKRIYEQIRREVDGTLKPHLTGDFPDLKLALPIPGLDTPSFDVPGCFNLEPEFLEERKRCLKLKADLDWLKRQHEREVAELRKRHEGQLNQVREELQTTVHQDSSVLELQNEMKTKDRIINDFKQENEKMFGELKDIKRLLLKLMVLLKTDNDSVCVYP